MVLSSVKVPEICALPFVIALFVAGAGCDPFTTGPGEPCSMQSSSTGTNGMGMMLGYTSYAVEARDAADVLAAVEFA